MKKLMIIFCAAALTLTVAACTPSPAKAPATSDVPQSSLASGEAPELIDPEALVPTDDAEELPLGYQFDLPEKGEEIAIITTNMGTIKMRFFPDAAPKAVYNFKALVQSGYYNGIIFHRVIDGFMIQGGDPSGIGTGGQSIWGENFVDEFSTKLLNFTGSVSMANAGKNTNGSQFFINNASEKIDWGFLEARGVLDMGKFSDEAKKLYDEKGGNVNLDGAFSSTGAGHTVFAQVFEGMETVNEISKVEVDSQSAKPLKEVVMEKVEIIPYS